MASPSAVAASFIRPMALSCAVIGALASARPPGSFTPTDVVEQLLLASAPTPTESEQTLIGTLALATGDDWPVEFVPVVESWPGSGMLPSSFDRTEMGAATAAGPAAAVPTAADSTRGQVRSGRPRRLPARPQRRRRSAPLALSSADRLTTMLRSPASRRARCRGQQSARTSVPQWKSGCSASCLAPFLRGNGHPCSRGLRHTRQNERLQRSVRRCARM